MAGTVWTAAEAVNNPIQWVQPDGGARQYVKCPSAYNVERDDISNSDAGRTASGTMIKSQLYVNNKPVRAVALSCEWAYPSDMDIAGILTVFEQAEYMTVSYYDPASAAYKTGKFYVGNRTMPMYNKPMGLWTSLSLKLISRN